MEHLEANNSAFFVQRQGCCIYQSQLVVIRLAYNKFNRRYI